MELSQISRTCKALSDPNRLRIIRLLTGGELCGCELLEQLQITQPTLSHHMKTLEDCGLVSSQKKGKWNHYSLDRDHWAAFRDYIESIRSAGTPQTEDNNKKRERALQCFADGLHCSQSVLAAFHQECGIPEEQAFRLGSCFGSGMRKGNVCGACSGALMVLGLLCGETRPNDPEGRKRTNELNDLFLDRFIEANGTCLCNELLGCDIRTKEGVQYARDHHLFTEFCPQMVASAVDILEGILRDRQ